MRLLLPLFIACAPDEPAPTPPRIASLAISPSELQIETGPDGGELVQYEVTATYADGTVAPLELVEWTLSNRSVGAIDEAGLFTPSTENGGLTWVKAELGDAVAFGTLTVIYAEEVVDGDVDPGLFDGPVTTVSGLWLYPEDGVNIPRNTPSLRFQWDDIGADAYRLHFESEVTDLTVYTASPEWTADQDVWPRIVSTNAGGEVWVDLWAYKDGQILGEAPIAIAVNRMDATGSIYYWSTSAAGIMEIPYGGQAVEFMTQASTGRCVACHSISRDGLIAFTYDGGNGNLGVKRMSDGADVIPYGAAYANFTTFSPDGRFLLGTANGALMLWDAPSGTFLWEVAVDGSGTHVDWSPDGDRVAFTYVPGSLESDWAFSASSAIAVMDHLGDGTFGAPQVVYTPPTDQKAYYPSWSPDGEWIAFNVSSEDAYDDTTAEVWVVSGDGGKGIRLDQANLGADLTNSWPRWAPLPDDDVLWLTFASRRDYGRVVAGTPQIWVAGFDPEKARAGADPSWPAFWLPGQDAAQGNHIPVWTQ